MFYEVMVIYLKMIALWNRFWDIDIFPVIIQSQIKGCLGFFNVLHFA